jgi:DNA anti-recombination protein RmuC
MGYPERTNVGFTIEGWPVQFLPVASPLDEEELEQAVEIDVAQPGEELLKARCLRAEHVVATALKVGRLKDLARIQAFLEQDAVDLKRLKSVLERHKLMGAWNEFCLKAAIKNPLLEIE